MLKTIGITFPIPKSLIPRFFRDGKTVFIKPATAYKELRPGMKFVFYQSCEDTGCVGEATIKKITLAEDPFEFFKIYTDEIFLTEKELCSYKRPSKKWIAIELESIKKYDSLIKPKRFIPVGGKYIKIEESFPLKE